MKKDKKEKKANKSTSRRDFLKLGLTLGTGTVIGGGLLSSLTDAKAETNETSKVMTTKGEVMEVNTSHLKALGDKTDEMLGGGDRDGIKGRKWTMVIDLAKCRNAKRCVGACSTAHQLKPSEQYHINILRMQDEKNTAPYFMPKLCQHCDNPPCTKVCPVDATFKRGDGIVLIDNERCIGCRFCIAACPYSARIFNWSEPINAEKFADKEYNIELNVPQKRGTVSKCLFSADRLKEGKLPYCVEACPNSVFWFGDLNEDAVTNGSSKETVKFSDLIRDNAGYTILPELGTKPSVYYLPPKNRLFPFEYQGKKTLDDDKH